MFQMLECCMAPSVSTPAEGSLEQSALSPIKDGPEVRPGFKSLRFRILFDAKHKIFSNLLSKTVDIPKLEKKRVKNLIRMNNFNVNCPSQEYPIYRWSV